MVAEFTLAVAAAWLAPLQPLARQLQGNVVARRLYLQSNIPQQLCVGSGCDDRGSRMRHDAVSPLPHGIPTCSSTFAMPVMAAIHVLHLKVMHPMHISKYGVASPPPGKDHVPL